MLTRLTVSNSIRKKMSSTLTLGLRSLSYSIILCWTCWCSMQRRRLATWTAVLRISKTWCCAIRSRSVSLAESVTQLLGKVTVSLSIWHLVSVSFGLLLGQTHCTLIETIILLTSDCLYYSRHKLLGIMFSSSFVMFACEQNYWKTFGWKK